jgi:hypothetical protein
MSTATAQRKLNRGIKRRCTQCNTLFYDMLHYPIQCPKCGSALSSKLGTSAAATRAKAAVARKRSKASAAKAKAVAPRQPAAETEDVDELPDQEDMILDRADDEDA